MVQKYGLWGAIAGIFLLAIVGVRSAATWLSETTPEPESSVTIGSNRVLSGETDEQSPVFNSQDRNGDTTQADIRLGDSPAETPGQLSATDGNSLNANELSQVTNTFSPLEEAGTYIQRQKRVERDPVVAASTVTINAVASSDPVAASPDSRVEQPEAANNTQTDQSGSAAPASQAVPALW